MPLIHIQNQNILIISDTHGKHRKLTIPQNIEIIIHCGDICNDGDLDEIQDFFNWYSSLEIPHKIFVNGNHDWPFELEPNSAIDLIPDNIIWLREKSIKLKGIKITGINPYCIFHNRILGSDIDILVFHYPSFGILDNGIGDEKLRDLIFAIKPKYVVFGHNHDGFGRCKTKNVNFVNSSYSNKLSKRT